MTPYLVSYIYLILSYILIGWLAGWLVAATSVNQIRWNDDNVVVVVVDWLGGKGSSNQIRWNDDTLSCILYISYLILYLDWMVGWLVGCSNVSQPNKVE